MNSTRWQKLVTYYRSCVSAENTADAQFQLANDGRDFVHVFNEECISAGTSVLEFGDEDESFRSFVQAARWSKTPATYFYGFPCRIEGRFIRPVFIFDVEETAGETGRAFVVQPNQPRINAAGLGFLSQEERRQAEQTLNECWDENESLHANVDATLHKLEAILPSLNRNDLLSNWDGAFFRALDSTYTRGLEQELGHMEAGAANEIWDLILDRNGGPVEEGGPDILEVTPLNDEQRRAVKSAFVNPLTVVTGPPGTGKSQVVLNVIANALACGETVLFGSRNRKAVDVVVERLSSMQSQPVILRYGEQESTFTNRLLQSLDRASLQDRDTLDREISEHEGELEHIRNREEQARLTLERIVDRRNRIEEIEVTLEDIAAEMPMDIATSLRPYEEHGGKPSFHRLLGMMEQLMTEMEHPNPMTWVRSLFGKPIDKRLREAAQGTLAAMPDCCASLPTESVEDCRELAFVGRTIGQWVRLQHELLDSVDKNWNEPRIEVLRARIANGQKLAVEITIKLVDALMQHRLKNLTSAQRRAVSDYAVHTRVLRENYAGEELQQKLRQASADAFRNGIRGAFPAIAVSNLTVRRAVPLARNAVDLVVIDEASQCDIASALPLLYRGKRALVIGDPYQLRHISHLRPADDARLLSNAGLNSTDDQRFMYSTNSLFDIARTVVGLGARFMELREHYRSRAEIIGFSNKEFYGDYMTVETDYRQRRLVSSTQPVTWHDIQGRTSRPSSGGALNESEAQAVIGVVQDIVSKTRGRRILHSSLGVVTPFRAQANRIHDLVKNNIDKTELQRLDFAVGTAHGYQGDEKDVIVFSPVISGNTPDSAVWFVGSTWNLFNVAITRARSELHVVGDMTACAQSGIPFLSKFVSYVEGLQTNLSLGETQGSFESPWEEVLFNALERAGIETLSQYRFDQYKLDLAIPDSMIDIEIDGEYWHRNLDGSRVLSDLKRDTHLETRGWRVKRFWVYELRSDLDRCVREVKELLAA